MKYSSPVIKGAGRGQGIGYPTFNLQVPQDFNLKPGIYACWVWVEGEQYQGAMHFGPIPTFNEQTPSLEIFVLDYSPHDLVNQLSFEPIKYLRPIKKFSSPQDLSHQITIDVNRIRNLSSTSR